MSMALLVGRLVRPDSGFASSSIECTTATLNGNTCSTTLATIERKLSRQPHYRSARKKQPKQRSVLQTLDDRRIG